MRNINVVIADDSALLRQALKDVLEKSGFIKVIASARNGEEAVNFVKKYKPDVLILDVEMPVMNGLRALKIIMKENPLPVFMFSSLTFEGAAVTIEALENGAIDFLPKPMKGSYKLDEVADELIKKLKFITIKFRTAQLAKKGLIPTREKIKPKEPDKRVSEIRKISADIVAMGSSMGGVQMAMKIFPKFPENMKPIVWVQHMPPNFTKSFADRLNSIAKITVKEAEDGEKVEKGVCYLAPGGKQMGIKKAGSNFYINLNGAEKVSGHCPSCDYLFFSLEPYCHHNMIGVILTGMGSDGAEGLFKLHKKGAFVIGQNEESCIVYGMPKVAYKKGAVDIELDINDIPDAIIKAGGSY